MGQVYVQQQIVAGKIFLSRGWPLSDCVLLGKAGRHRKATSAPTIHAPTTPIHLAVSPLYKHSLTLPKWLVLCVCMHVCVYCVHVCVRAHTCVGVFRNGLWIRVGP